MKTTLSTFIRSTGATLGLAAAMSITTHADPLITQVTSSSAFSSMLAGTVYTDDLESPGAALTTNYTSVYAGYQSGQTPFSTALGSITSPDNVYYAASPSTGLGAGDGSYYALASGPLVLHLNPGLAAVGSGVFNSYFDKNPTSVVVTETDGTNFYSNTFTIYPKVGDGTASSLTFEGFVATPGDTLVSISYSLTPDYPGYVGVDNLIGATAVSVPEPSTYALLGAGLVALTVAVRRRKSAGV